MINNRELKVLKKLAVVLTGWRNNGDALLSPVGQSWDWDELPFLKTTEYEGQYFHWVILPLLYCEACDSFHIRIEYTDGFGWSYVYSDREVTTCDFYESAFEARTVAVQRFFLEVPEGEEREHSSMDDEQIYKDEQQDN